jgi:FemAB-related protein (PEP-CTERM system-associated)
MRLATFDTEPADPAMLEVAIASNADAAAWDAFATRCPGATGYHEWRWRSVFKRAFGHEPIYLAARRSGCIMGILPLVHIRSFVFGRTLTSLPFVNYGGVAAVSDSAAQLLLNEATEVARRTRSAHVELRHVARRFPELPCKQHKVAMLLRLQPGMWERLDRKVRNQIRKARKCGLTGEQGGAELLNDFYRVFARNMRDLGTPVYSRGFFEEVLRAFPERARIHLVRLKQEPIAGGLTYRTGATVEVPWASSVREHNALCPNHLLYWNVIESAVEAGCTVLDFGRSTPEEGTFRFKQQWGAEQQPLHWEYCLLSRPGLPDASPKNPKFRLAIQLWKRLPLSVANRIGPGIVRSIP